MPLDQFLEAADDVLAIIRGFWLATKEPTKRRRLAAAGRDLKAAIAIAANHEPGTPDHTRAMASAEAGINEAFGCMHFVEALAPVLGAAVGRMRKPR